MRSCSCQQKFIRTNPRTWCAEVTKLHISLISAENLPDIRHFGKMKVYARASLNGTNTIKTKVDKERETNPTWDFSCDFTVNLKEASVLTVKLYCDRTQGDKCIGAIQIPVSDLFQWPENVTAAYPVAGTTHGKLNIRYTTSLARQACHRSPC
ncbi:hypothetical protein C2S51_008007 [Perilla frutescens var. frutescens]|nr:hypothetical protein C2S51_008007 [Perilla frutescens var. frutescens]